MNQSKGTGAVGAWLVVGCVVAIGFALFGGPKAETVKVEPAPAPVQAALPPPPKQAFAESLLEMAPATRLVLARDFASYGLKVSADRREAYAMALALLQRFPATDAQAPEAAGLEREVVARQNLPAADKRPVTDSELLAFASRVMAATKPSPAPVAPDQARRSGDRGPRAEATVDAQAIRNGDKAPPSVVGMMRDAGWAQATADKVPTSPSPVYVPAPAYASPPAHTPTNAGGDVHVRGYYRSDGTYVRPHTRSRPSR
jgi:hypothetical protein